MKSYLSLILWITIMISTMQAQQFSGEYYLTGVHEMAAGFNFTPDGKFQFFYIYGAVDRNATGTYTVDGDTIRLKSDKEPGNDFTIASQRRKGDGFTIHIQDANKLLASTVRALYFVNGEKYEEFADNDGFIRIDAPCEKIYVQHQIYPDIVTLIKDENNKNNYFELTLNPSLVQVSFKGIDLIINGDILTCLPNYFMPMENIRFVRN